MVGRGPPGPHLRPAHQILQPHPSLFTDIDAFWSFSKGATVFAAEEDDDTCRFNHVRNFDNPPWPCVFLLDPHPRKPHMFCWVQVDPSDDLWVVAEGNVEGDPVDVRNHVERVERELGLTVGARIVDPNMGRSPASARRGITWQDEFDAAGLYCELGDDSDVGRARLNEYLKPDRHRWQPRIHVHPRCTDTIFQIKRYVWEDFRRKDEKDLKNKPRDKNDDYPTLLKYCMNYDPSFTFLHAGPTVLHRAGTRKGAY